MPGRQPREGGGLSRHTICQAVKGGGGAVTPYHMPSSQGRGGGSHAIPYARQSREGGGLSHHTICQAAKGGGGAVMPYHMPGSQGRGEGCHAIPNARQSREGGGLSRHTICQAAKGGGGAVTPSILYVGQGLVIRSLPWTAQHRGGTICRSVTSPHHPSPSGGDDDEGMGGDYKSSSQFRTHLKKSEANSEFSRNKSLMQQRRSLPVYTVREELLQVCVCVCVWGSSRV